jgi:protein-tyrosine phosphatase
MTVAETSRLLPTEGVLNMRELGGYQADDGRKLKFGRVIRSADLSKMTPTDQEFLRQRVATIVDLRTTAERTDSPTPEIAGVENVHLPIFEQGGHDNNITRAVAAAADGTLEEAPMLEINREFVTSELASSSYRRLIELVISAPDGKAVLFHCTAGKDRTGMAAVIILSALGVDMATIRQDYLETNEHLAPLVHKIVSAIPDPQEAEVIRSFWIAEPTYLDAAFDEMNNRFGSVAGYLNQGLGITPATAAALRSRLLD